MSGEGGEGIQPLGERTYVVHKQIQEALLHHVCIHFQHGGQRRSRPSGMLLQVVNKGVVDKRSVKILHARGDAFIGGYLLHLHFQLNQPHASCVYEPPGGFDLGV